MGQKTNLPISREKAIEFLKSITKSKTDMNHYLASEEIMRNLAKHFGEDEEYWAMLGLLHDIDWPFTKENVSQHGIKAKEILEKLGFDEEFIQNVQSHVYGYKAVPEFKNKVRTKKIEHCLAAAETITGLIYAYALMRGKKISDMKVKGLKKKFKDKTFAANCNREIIREIEKAGLSLDEFFEIAISSTKKIKNEIGLI